MLVRIHWWQRDMDALRASLERLAESAEASKLVDEERYALTQLVRLAPDEQRYLDRLNLLGGLPDEAPEDFLRRDDASSDVPEFETFAVVEDEDEIEQPAAPAADEFESNAINFDTVNFETGDFETGSFETGSEFVTSGGTEFETNAGGVPTFSDPTASFADLNDDRSDVATDVIAAGEPGTPEDGARMEGIMRQELESVDFYIAQGYSDIAVDTLEMLERQFGSHPDILARREKLAAAGGQPAAEAPAVFEFGGVEEVPAARAEEPIAFNEEAAYAALGGEPGEVREQPPVTPVAAPIAAPAGSGIDAGLAELFEEFRVAEE